MGVRRTEVQFREVLRRVGPKVISFDIFDTLLDRVAEQPIHVFALVEADVFLATNGKIRHFRKARVGAEAVCRKRSRSDAGGPEQEVTLDEIYEVLREEYRLSAAEVAASCNCEVEMERRVVRQRREGRALFDIAATSAKRLVAISDMYLPKVVVAALLRDAGYPEIPIYLSSDLGVRKHDGYLFQRVHEVEAVEYGEWLHVGDNPRGDVGEPRKLGIHTFHLPSSAHTIRNSEKLGSLIRADRSARTVAESAIWGLIQRRLFDDPHAAAAVDSHFGADPLELGYAGAGPVLFGFLQWVMSSALADGIQQLVFLSPGGQALKRVADVLFPVEEGWPASSNIGTYGRLATFASLRNENDIVDLIESSSGGTSIGEIVGNTLHLELNEAMGKALHRWGFHSTADEVQPERDTEGIRGFALEFRSEILKEAGKQAQTLRQLCLTRGIDFGASGLVAAVDIADAGPTQSALQSLTGCANVSGYYYVTHSDALGYQHLTGQMKGYVGTFARREIHTAAIAKYLYFFETIFGEAAPRARNGRRDDARVLAAKSDEFIGRVQEGAVAFAVDLRASFGTLASGFQLSPELAERALVSFLTKPGPVDGRMLEGIMSVESAKARSRYIVAPRQALLLGDDAAAGGLWKEGSAALARTFEANGRPNEVSVGQARFSTIRHVMRMVEGFVVKRCVTERKFAKYGKSRELFFRESKAPIGRTYWECVGRFFC